MWTWIQCWLLTDFRDSSRHPGVCRKSPSSFTPESCRFLLPLRSSFLRLEGLDLRAEASLWQLVLDRLHHLNLNKEQVMHFMLEHPKCICETCDMNMLKWPQILQDTVWTVQKIAELHPWIMHVIGAQVQVFEVGRVGIQSRGQKITAGHRQLAVHQSE